MRLVLDDAHTGAWNMAVDEALLESAARGQTATLRFYRWSEPTLSLGYFQRCSERRQHTPSIDCALIRRSSGGGAIMHDQELTYSFTSPIADRIAADVEKLYHDVHGSLVEALGKLGIPAKMRKPAKQSLDGPEPFLCFQRCAEGDVILEGHKIAGSAQRRRRLAVLQHGSLLLSRSAFAPELFGVQQLAPSALSVDQLLSVWLERLAARLGVAWRQGELHQEEIQIAKVLQRQKHLHANWIQKR